MKVCANCKTPKIKEEFYVNKNNKRDGLSSWCKMCQKSHKKEHYNLNKTQYQKNYLNNFKWLIDIKKELKCEKCGFNHPAALDFHHIDPKTKSFGLGGRISERHREEILLEIDKCIVLCANCHRIEHSIHINNYLNTVLLA